MTFEVHELTQPDDLDHCAEMMVSTPPWSVLYFTKEQCRTDLMSSLVRVHGAVSPQGEIVAFLASMANGIGFEPLIEYLCVKDELRGQGIGSRLISYFEETLFPIADNLYLFVSDINPHAIRLYVKLGYVQVGALPNFNLENQTEYLHRKTRRPRQIQNITF